MSNAELATECFSAGYAEAHAKFRAAADAAGAAVRRYAHPRRGPDGEELFLTAARLGPRDARRVLFVLSGVHGVEGYAGSAIQTTALRQAQALPEGVALVHAHLLNPWGLAWNRREDHENIDVFRNLLYLDTPSVADPLFDLIDDAMDWPNYGKHTPEHIEAVRADLVKKCGGMDRLIAAIRRGQHHRPRGMNYHGDHPCWTLETFRDIVAENASGCDKVAVLDIHTGFGAYGGALVMSYDPPEDPRHARVRRWFDNEIYVPGSDADIPAHAQSPYGFLSAWTQSADVTAAIIEFGTFPPDETRDTFPANHYHHLFGDPRSPEALRIAALYRRFLYPEEEGWKRSVAARGVDAVARMAAGLGAWS